MALSAIQIAEIYETAKKVHQNILTRAKAISNLQRSGIPKVQVADGIDGFRKMRKGERYTRTLTGQTTAHFLERLSVDFPEDGLEKALAALWAHIEYLEPTRGSVCRQERKLYEEFSGRLRLFRPQIYPDEVSHSEFSSQKFIEGATRQVLVNQYERDSRARSECIRHWGTTCYVCRFDFHKTYGEMGRGFIHVHHLKDIASIGIEYQVDPRIDLRPVCPNCHAMLHTHRPAMDIEELKTMLANTANNDIVSSNPQDSSNA